MKSFEILDKRTPSPSRGGPGKGHLDLKVQQILSTGMIFFIEKLKFKIQNAKSNGKMIS